MDDRDPTPLPLAYQPADPLSPWPRSRAKWALLLIAGMPMLSFVIWFVIAFNRFVDLF